MEATLLSLLPTYTAGALPGTLSALATALLAQSRSKASVLRPDEEIARVYTCCHIACERLKQRLNLPKIEPRPPCGPRVYKKLYSHLDAALLSRSQNDKATLTLNPTAVHQSPGQIPAGSKSKLSAKDGRPTVPSSSLKETSLRKRDAHEALTSTTIQPGVSDTVPEWLIPSLRHLCNKLAASNAYPHVYTGVLSIHQANSIEQGPRPSKRKARDSLKTPTSNIHVQDWPALIIAVLLIVLANMPAAVDPPELIGPAVQELINLKLIEVKQSNKVFANVEELLEAEGPKWEEMDWFKSIAQSSSLNFDEMHSDEDSFGNQALSLQVTSSQNTFPQTSQRNETAIERTMKPNLSSHIGLNTMMQERVDWLSEERQLDFIRWKAQILEKVEQIEKLQK